MSQLDIFVLKQCLQAGSSFISGSTLAKECNISRVAIWGHLDKLKEEGFIFEAIRNKGYRLIQTPLIIHPSLLQAHLELLNCNNKVHFFNSIDSTSSEVERLLASGEHTPFAVISRTMSQGRGRRGRSWSSSDTGNLYISFGFRPEASPSYMHRFTLWMGLHVCDLLNTYCNIPIQMKWPNDLMVNNRKCSGMLTEARIDSEHMRDLTFGIGLNVNTTTEHWPPELLNKATALAKATGYTLDINALAAQLISILFEAYETYMHAFNIKHFSALWDRYNYLADQMIVAKKENTTIQGHALGLDDCGRLLIKQKNGATHALDSGEVSIQY